MVDREFLIPPFMKYKSVRSEFKVQQDRGPDGLALGKVPAVSIISFKAHFYYVIRKPAVWKILKLSEHILGKRHNNLRPPRNALQNFTCWRQYN